MAASFAANAADVLRQFLSAVLAHRLFAISWTATDIHKNASNRQLIRMKKIKSERFAWVSNISLKYAH
jgi:hypothetical protein